MRTIPTIQTSPRYSYRIELAGVSYILAYNYNSRTANWHMSIYDTDENPLHVGIKIVRNFPLLLRDVGAEFPEGMIYGISYGSGPVGRDGLRTRDTSLVIFSEDEYQSILDIITDASPSADVTFTPVV